MPPLPGGSIFSSPSPCARNLNPVAGFGHQRHSAEPVFSLPASCFGESFLFFGCDSAGCKHTIDFSFFRGSEFYNRIVNLSPTRSTSYFFLQLCYQTYNFFLQEFIAGSSPPPSGAPLSPAVAADGPRDGAGAGDAGEAAEGRLRVRGHPPVPRLDPQHRVGPFIGGSWERRRYWPAAVFSPVTF